MSAEDGHSCCSYFDFDIVVGERVNGCMLSLSYVDRSEPDRKGLLAHNMENAFVSWLCLLRSFVFTSSSRESAPLTAAL